MADLGELLAALAPKVPATQLAVPGPGPRLQARRAMMDASQRRSGSKTGATLKLLDPKLRAEILEHAARGTPIKTCCGAVGINVVTLHTWERRALKGEEPFASFFEELLQAQERGKRFLVGTIQSAAEGGVGKDGIWRNQWGAGAWLLERQYPDDYGRIDRIKNEITKINDDTNIDVRKLSDEEVITFRALLAKATSEAAEPDPPEDTPGELVDDSDPSADIEASADPEEDTDGDG